MDSGMNLVNRLCSTACRVASREVLRGFDGERKIGLGGARTHNQRLKMAIFLVYKLL